MVAAQGRPDNAGSQQEHPAWKGALLGALAAASLVGVLPMKAPAALIAHCCPLLA